MKGGLANAVLIGAAVLGLGAVLVVGIGESKRTAGQARVGEPAPDFVMPRYGGGQVSLAELRGRVVMLNFWASWCGPCVEELPYMVKLAREFEDRGLTFVAASRDDAPADVGIFLDRRVPDAAPYVTISSDAMAGAYAVQALPMTYFIDREGKVLELQRGKVSEASLRRMIEQALGPTP